MEGLKGLDDVAYVRFASVYRNFREARDFNTIVGELEAEPEPPRRRRPRRGGSASRPRQSAPPGAGRRGRALDGRRAPLRTTQPRPGGAQPFGRRADRARRRRGRARRHRAGRTAARRTLAIDQAGEAARGATLYVTLEPCSHFGATPPCAEAIVAAGMARVVCALEDPDAASPGSGFARLRAAGIA